jgi:hypothetical protein
MKISYIDLELSAYKSSGLKLGKGTEIQRDQGEGKG